jgi:hypothetical protein
MDDGSPGRPWRKALGSFLRCLATRWSTPGARQVVVCSHFVGFVAGLGAVAFLLSLEFLIRRLLGDVMG